MTAAGDQQTQQERLVEHVTCLGCGCACDDIAVRVRAGRILDARNACRLGVDWFGDGSAPTAIRVDGRDADLGTAIDTMCALLDSSRSPLVYLAPELSCEAQRAAVALADLLHARLDSITSSTALASILAAQERGRAGATLGEIRNRADLLLFWGVDPDDRYPRFWSRYAPEPPGLQVPEGRRARMVIAADIGNARGPADADIRIPVAADDEVATLTAVEAIVRNRSLAAQGPLWTRARDLAARLTARRYVAIVADGEVSSSNPSSRGTAEGDDRRPHISRASALISLSQALNEPTRCALSTLRGGGNRAGAEAVLTWQTGYPTAVDFTQGVPTYRPRDAAAARPDVVLITGDATQLPPDVATAVATVPHVIIGPRASAHADARVAIDTGTAGIHAGGTALRMDDVPLPLRPVLSGPADPVAVLRTLIARLTAAVGTRLLRDESEDPSLHRSSLPPREARLP